jgi:hypothetical protein
MTPTGPSPLTNESLTSASSASIMTGIQNASVFPEPVKAMPIMSLPENLNGNQWLLEYTVKYVRCGDALQLNRRWRQYAVVFKMLQYRRWNLHFLSRVSVLLK